ncbi:hypothetical protein CH373_15100 [Leptospira perolatii]|uniref:Purine nucleoside phosphorylase n=1 Tax=Leptospira perolatii TaxID=2023191 RepID=A0A2M9ZJN1_9LEPT|nr:polyphenol oxidase family protein [Leptospira perolatii]PJZ68595.1 hypothetical protein CH360_15555 [Leptospira perolatii]PJZ72250.1 hypothetical protein CH373_15100 [Leptospira perolatii]
MISRLYKLDDQSILKILVLGKQELQDFENSGPYIRSKVSHYSGISQERIHVLDQVHGVKALDADLLSGKEMPEADAFFTAQKNRVLVIKTADCLPIFFWNKNIAGAIHSGWKGTLGGITELTLKKTEKEKGIKLEELRFFLGPYATGKHYEVGEDVASLFRKEFPDCLTPIGDSGKFLLEQKSFLEMRLSKLGIFESLENSQICTMSEDSGFFSHRKKDSARNLNCIWMESVTP